MLNTLTNNIKEYDRYGKRFKNYFVYSENYLYILLRYIEQNPIEAKISNKIGQYRWCTSTSILNNNYLDLINGSELINKDLIELIGKSLNDNELERLEALQKTTYKKSDDKIIRLKPYLSTHLFISSTSLVPTPDIPHHFISNLWDKNCKNFQIYPKNGV